VSGNFAGGMSIQTKTQPLSAVEREYNAIIFLHPASRLSLNDISENGLHRIPVIMVAGDDGQTLNPRLKKAPRYFVTFRLFIVSMVASDDNSIELAFCIPNGIDNTLQCFSSWNTLQRGTRITKQMQVGELQDSRVSHTFSTENSNKCRPAKDDSCDLTVRNRSTSLCFRRMRGK
jgi:hypothetical protein